MTKLYLLYAQLLLLSFDNFEELSRPQIHFLVVGVDNNMNIRNFKNSIRMILGVGVVSATLLVGATAQADVVNIDINNGTDYQGLAAAPDAAGTAAFWNGVGNGTSTGLLDSNNTVTNVSVSLNGGTVEYSAAIKAYANVSYCVI